MLVSCTLTHTHIRIHARTHAHTLCAYVGDTLDFTSTSIPSISTVSECHYCYLHPPKHPIGGQYLRDQTSTKTLRKKDWCHSKLLKDLINEGIIKRWIKISSISNSVGYPDVQLKSTLIKKINNSYYKMNRSSLTV